MRHNKNAVLAEQHCARSPRLLFRWPGAVFFYLYYLKAQ